ncbi:hypothetical protein [Endozoicomonas ascidiicola]|uniref:hypothetical protein n=1 Tax=Endozoicomonas ascidiicola TaxID=1698521 RepID=UPI00083353FA|nr:hypothetical protein [Endozoicomonas ascidiicola]
MQRLSKKQINWFKSATAKERDSFLAHGEAGAIELLDANGMMKVYAPAIRGHIVGEPKPSREEATHYAEVRLHPLQVRAVLNDVRLDEKALGIEGFHSLFVQQARGDFLKLETILPELAHCEQTLPVTLLLELQSIIGENRKELEEYLPLWLLDEEEETPEQGQKNFLDVITRDQVFGFLVYATTPIPQVFNGQEVHGTWDYTTGWWFYDETIERIWAQARAWRKAYLERKRQVAFEE